MVYVCIYIWVYNSLISKLARDTYVHVDDDDMLLHAAVYMLRVYYVSTSFLDARVNTYVRVDDDDILLHAAVYMLRVATMLLCVRIYELICAARVHDDDNK